MDSSSSDDDALQKCANSDPKSGMDNLPAKSREKYLKCYEYFTEWRTSRGEQSFSEAVLLAYFQELSKTRQATTLWVTYSMLRATIRAYDNVNINTYYKLLKYLKGLSKGHVSKKSKVFSAEEVETFLNDAPDDVYLAMKVGLIFGVSGACRATELVKIRTCDIKKHSDQALVVNLMKSPTKIERSFVIRDDYVKIVEKYQALRPPDESLDRFFMFYHNGKCTRQAIGRHKICEFPKKIAQFLNLPNPELYTGHCLRRTSASLLVQSGADAVMLRQCGGWKSNQGIVQYFDDSYTKRVRIDAPRVPLPPNNAVQNEAQIAETQQCESQLAETQQWGSQIAGTQQCGPQIAGTQQWGCQIAGTQQCGPQIAGTQERWPQIADTPQHGSQIAGTQQRGLQIAATPERWPQIAGTQQCGPQIAVTQQCGPQIAGAQQRWPQIAGAQQREPQLADAQQRESQIAGTQQCGPQIAGTQQGSQLAENNTQGQSQWIEINDTAQAQTQQCEPAEADGICTIKIQQCKSLPDDTQSNWSESDDSQSLKTDDPFDRITEEYEMAASPAARPESTEPRRPRPFLLSVRQLAALERRRLRLDEVRARQLHARETERLRVEARRVEVDAERNAALKRIADVALAFLDYASPP